MAFECDEKPMTQRPVTTYTIIPLNRYKTLILDTIKTNSAFCCSDFLPFLSFTCLGRG